ncbi:hypothetical protein PDE_08106 [Penicillium oxalicum 114-2]|uniref:Uncharacterized protein n=1 Tax=Penicillium oxalicum (strain 114-2 / CGMCC 5302) TaxID=933388 RepID=S7ZRR7_PENO1|nr:hypothetical protein PDE_08106 [Penicillium oxalicum 114-2]
MHLSTLIMPMDGPPGPQVWSDLAKSLRRWPSCLMEDVMIILAWTILTFGGLIAVASTGSIPTPYGPPPLVNSGIPSSGFPILAILPIIHTRSSLSFHRASFECFLFLLHNLPFARFHLSSSTHLLSTPSMK